MCYPAHTRDSSLQGAHAKTPMAGVQPHLAAVPAAAVAQVRCQILHANHRLLLEPRAPGYQDPLPPSAAQPREQSGAWQEPGRWSGSCPAEAIGSLIKALIDWSQEGGSSEVERL